MICYRDRTFCKEDGCKKFSECPRALTEKIKKDAEEFGLPIMQFASIPECFESDFSIKVNLELIELKEDEIYNCSRCYFLKVIRLHCEQTNMKINGEFPEKLCNKTHYFKKMF